MTKDIKLLINDIKNEFNSEIIFIHQNNPDQIRIGIRLTDTTYGDSHLFNINIYTRTEGAFIGTIDIQEHTYEPFGTDVYNTVLTHKRSYKPLASMLRNIVLNAANQ